MFFQCRIYLQCGDIFNADQQHSKSKSKLPNNIGSGKSNSRDLIDKGLRSVAQNDFEEGLAFFQSALKQEPHNVTVSASQYPPPDYGI